MNLLAGSLLREDDRLSVRLEGAPHVTIAVPPGTFERLPEAGAVVIGVRPEHIRTSPVDGLTLDSQGLEAILELAEALGHEQLLHVKVGALALTVRGLPGVRPAVGSAIRLHADTAHVHLFDAATGVSLRRAD